MNFQPEFFVYPVGTSFDPLFGMTLTFSEQFDIVKFDSDADFEVRRLVMFGGDSLNPQTESTRYIPQINFNIRDDATGRTLFSNYVSTAELFGDGRVPFVLPTSHFFKRATTAQMLYDPVDPGIDFDASTIWLALVGVKHYEKGLVHE